MFEYMTAQEAAENGKCHLGGYNGYAKITVLTEL